MRQLITEPGKFSWERVGMALNTTIALGEKKRPGLIGAQRASKPISPLMAILFSYRPDFPYSPNSTLWSLRHIIMACVYVYGHF